MDQNIKKQDQLFQTEIEDDTDVEKDEDMEKYLTFFVDSQLYTIPSSRVVEIISMSIVTYMPSVPDYIKGVINIRGKVVPLIDLQLRLKKTPTVIDDQTCVVVIEIEDNNVGLIVDRVHDVTDIGLSQINPPPKVTHAKDKEVEYLAGIAKLENDVAMILDLEKALENPKQEAKVPLTDIPAVNI